MISPGFNLSFLFKTWHHRRLRLRWWRLLFLLLMLMLVLLFIALFHGCSMELESCDNLSSGLGHVKKPFLVRPSGVESSPDLFFVLLRVLVLLSATTTLVLS
ncbi:hypothetical protein PanWU01x14_059830 [Parasponia andersonii]|uniref:Transmembrane protein n=1 Tax=Parasponia andersonii TaxID=3476 RepID=A0A2P5DIK6_PARAD|nr:hypothetical protein PanWU01x14_059830 [Parasponia andersonii]